MKKRIYLDHAATTPVDKRVLKKMQPWFSEKFGNASSLHFMGKEAREAMEKSREEIAKRIRAEPSEIYFTSGGTEADNIALKGAAFGNRKKGKHLVTSKIEHHAVEETCKFLESDGFSVTYAGVGKNGLVDTGELENAITEKTTLVSVMHANNEIGTVQPVKEIGERAGEKGAYFHTDAVQSVGKLPVDVKKMGIDLLSASAHKFYGPKGAGFLFAKEGTKMAKTVHGGGHERGLRSGTENIAGIVGMAEALKIAAREREEESAREKKMRDHLVKRALEIENSWLNGAPSPRLPGNANLGFDFVEGESMVLMLSDKGIAASTGSACSTRSLEPSHVLRAIGLPHVKCHGSLRFTLGRENRKKDVDYLLEALPPIVERLRSISPLHKGTDTSKFEEKVGETHGHRH